jgi:hypothetical protein
VSDERIEELSPEEQEVARDEKAAVEEEPEATEYIEFVGTDPQYGTTFHTSHSVSKAHFKKFHDLTVPKDLVWTRGANGRFLVPVSDMTPEAAEVLVNDPMFKRVTVSN